MNKYNLLTVISSLFLVLSLCVSIVLAQEASPPPMLLKSIVDYKRDTAIASLKLSKDQEGSIKRIVRDAREELAPRIDYLLSQRRLLQDKIGDHSNSTQELLVQFRTIQSVEEEMFLKKVDVVRNIQGVLTEEQRQFGKLKRAEIQAKVDLFISTLRSSLVEWLEQD